MFCRNRNWLYRGFRSLNVDQVPNEQVLWIRLLLWRFSTLSMIMDLTFWITGVNMGIHFWLVPFFRQRCPSVQRQPLNREVCKPSILVTTTLKFNAGASLHSNFTSFKFISRQAYKEEAYVCIAVPRCERFVLFVDSVGCGRCVLRK